MHLASNFQSVVATHSDRPLYDSEIMRVAPSIFADRKHETRSDRYTYIPTIDVLHGLRNEGFEPFAVCQTRVRDESKREHTKHLLRLRHPSQITSTEANEILLLNSHDGTSSYQMFAGMFRFVCHNGMVCGDAISDIRIPHKGNVVDRVIDGAFTVLEGFELANEQRDSMKAVMLNEGEKNAFARAALTLKYGNPAIPTPITETQLLTSRRFEDHSSDLWTIFSRVQENLIKGGLQGRSRTGRVVTTRAVTGIDQGVQLNRALWVLADEMRRLKA